MADIAEAAFVLWRHDMKEAFAVVTLGENKWSYVVKDEKTSTTLIAMQRLDQSGNP